MGECACPDKLAGRLAGRQCCCCPPGTRCQRTRRPHPLAQPPTSQSPAQGAGLRRARRSGRPPAVSVHGGWVVRWVWRVGGGLSGAAAPWRVWQPLAPLPSARLPLPSTHAPGRAGGGGEGSRVLGRRSPAPGARENRQTEARRQGRGGGGPPARAAPAPRRPPAPSSRVSPGTAPGSSAGRGRSARRGVVGITC